MFFDSLTEETIKEIYYSLIKIYGNFDYTKLDVKINLIRFCRDRKIIFDHHCISKVIEKQVIKTDTSYLPISGNISGIYVPSFCGGDEKYISDADIKQLLNKHKNKNITILIMEIE